MSCDICENGFVKEWAAVTAGRCDQHDVCIDCKTPRKNLTETPWGHRLGFRCAQCARDRVARKISEYKASGADDDDRCMTADPICPNCGEKYSDAWDLGDIQSGRDISCGNCDVDYFVESYVEISYTTRPKSKGDKL